MNPMAEGRGAGAEQLERRSGWLALAHCSLLTLLTTIPRRLPRHNSYVAMLQVANCKTNKSLDESTSYVTDHKSKMSESCMMN